MKLKENAFLWVLTGLGVVALALAIDTEREPSGFFVAVRALVCFASAYAAVRAYRANKEVWTWLLGANAALYNPFVLVHLTRDVWDVLGILDIALLVAAGIVLRVRQERPDHASEPSSRTANSPAVPVKEKEYRTPSRTERALWLILLFLLLAGVFMDQYFAYIAGTAQAEAQNRNIGSATFGLLFWAYIIARVRRWRRPGRIALGCFVAGLVTLFVASAAGGFTQAREMNEAFASIERFDPALAARLKVGAGADGIPLSAMMRRSLSRAIEQAPDTAVVTFMLERFAIIHGDNPAALERCVAAFNGSGDFHLNGHEQLRMMKALGNLYSAAAAAHRASPSEEERRAGANLLIALYKKIDPDGILNDDARMKTLSNQQKCTMYTRLMQELQALPTKEDAAAIRAMMAS
ncbi:MAG TPA: DUF6804 family protein [Gallionellaceae bacterium]|nr:DUF6804 family protein [Gallionellaceae bacterium]